PGPGATDDPDGWGGGGHRSKMRFTRRMAVAPARGMRPGGRAPLPRGGPARPDVGGAVRRRGPEHWPRPGVDHGREPTTTVPFHREVRTMSRASRWLAASFLLAACGGAPQAGTESGAALAREEVRAAAEAIDADQLLARISTLASDEFEGRAPGTVGEERTVEYLVNAFRELGLQPGNPNGTYTQEVSLIGYRAQPTASFTVAGRTIPLSFPSDFVAWTQHFDEPALSLTGSEIVFVGYGVVAPEYDWDDYKDVDVRGKTILMLVNDPAVPDPADPSRLDPNVFRGEAMTYYGRWTYKYEIASEKGAAAAIIVHETGPAGYPWEVVAGSWGGENFTIAGATAPNRVRVEAWITEAKAREVLAAAGHDFDALKQAAVRRDFRPVTLGATADFHIRTTTRQVQSRNVIAKLEGSDPERRNEYVIYTAHWDHLGKDESREG